MKHGLLSTRWSEAIESPLEGVIRSDLTAPTGRRRALFPTKARPLPAAKEPRRLQSTARRHSIAASQGANSPVLGTGSVRADPTQVC
jgi:hypothetical protein